MKYAYCYICGKRIKLTKDGKYYRHGYNRSFASKDWMGIPLGAGYYGKETKGPCQASGETPKRSHIPWINHMNT